MHIILTVVLSILFMLQTLVAYIADNRHFLALHSGSPSKEPYLADDSEQYTTSYDKTKPLAGLDRLLRCFRNLKSDVYVARLENANG